MSVVLRDQVDPNSRIYQELKKNKIKTRGVSDGREDVKVDASAPIIVEGSFEFEINELPIQKERFNAFFKNIRNLPQDTMETLLKELNKAHTFFKHGATRIFLQDSANNRYNLQHKTFRETSQFIMTIFFIRNDDTIFLVGVGNHVNDRGERVKLDNVKNTNQNIYKMYWCINQLSDCLDARNNLVL